jgi:CubicO group peptidase (beta-lactamase class C family)
MELTKHRDVFKPVTEYTEKIKQEMYASGSALVIMKDNEILHEWYSGTHHFQTGAKKISQSSQFNVYSTRVTYIGLAVSIAIYEGYLNLEDKISQYMNELDGEALGNTTLRHLLTRCTGLQIKNKKINRVFDLGTNIEGKNPELLAAIVEKSMGKKVNEILTERIFEPLNWTNTEWITEGKSNLVCDIHSPNSYPTLRMGSNAGDERNLYVSARELAYWGNLHLNKGLINGVQILPRKVFDLATSIQNPKTLPNKLPKFGFLWWIKDSKVTYKFNELGSDLPEGSYQILGASGCSCTVIPKLNTVAVRMYNSLNTYDNENFDHIKDIQTFGNLVISILNKL